MATFTHLRELYAEKRVCNLIDRTTGVVNLDLAEEQFPNLSRKHSSRLIEFGIFSTRKLFKEEKDWLSSFNSSNISETEVMEGFTQFITYDSNNDFRYSLVSSLPPKIYEKFPIICYKPILWHQITLCTVMYIFLISG